MNRNTGILAVAAILAVGVSGCTGFSYLSKNYASVGAQVVTIGCNDPYTVYDQRRVSKMLVVSDGVREITGCGIDERYDGQGGPAATRAKRLREAARTFLDETARDYCKITGESVFTDLQTEFTYVCTPAPEARGLKVPRLSGR
ncbi:hypothetical protein [Methylobacterium sp. 77]|uniref:hypothetical protein n=1 Tax=Methylobacterium sp. 77 TaxID=1101192 RepID=UPI00037A7F35|nr:hypothetical protein [Methylobacterium sp. 77]